MLPRVLLAAMIAGALSAPALAADMYVAPPTYGQSYDCAPPAEYTALPDRPGTFRGFLHQEDRHRIVYVEPFDPHYPPVAPRRIYVPAQPAYLASSLCTFGSEVSRRSWYDGKLFYRYGGEYARPDTFMIIERD
jgi:hypothetical protein